MRERWNRIRLGVWITVFAAAGVLEYIQLMYSFDLPQIILLMPLIGALCFIVLQKAGFVALAGTVVLSCLFQVLAGDTNAVMQLSLNASDVLHVILYVLPICLVFELLGMGAGALIRICIKHKCKTASGIICLLLGLLLIAGPYIALYRNPLYPIQARVQLSRYVEEHYSDYAISKKNMYFDLNTSSYCCRVIMADGMIRLASFGEDGTVTDVSGLP